MIALSFSEKLVRIVYTCISTAQFSLILNGQPSELFQSTRGVRQGDLMSPLLFVIRMEYLSRILNADQAGLVFTPYARNWASTTSFSQMILC